MNNWVFIISEAAAVLHNLSLNFELSFSWKAWIEYRTPSELLSKRSVALRRPACDNVRVNTSTPAPGWDDVILIRDSGPQHMASVTHTLIHQRASSNWPCGDSIVFPLPPNVSIKACWQLLPEAGGRTPDPLSVSSHSVSHMLSSARVGRGTGTAVFSSKDSPPIVYFFCDPHTTDLWPPPLTPLCVSLSVSVCVCVCARKETLNNVGMNYKLLLKPPKLD